MTAPVFVDTNVLVDGFDSSDPAKQSRAEQWLDHLWRHRLGRISTQVQHELYTTLTRKLTMPRDDARRIVTALEAWNPVVNHHDIVQRAWRLEDEHSLSWWDALIVRRRMPPARPRCSLRTCSQARPAAGSASSTPSRSRRRSRASTTRRPPRTAEGPGTGPRSTPADA